MEPDESRHGRGPLGNLSPRARMLLAAVGVLLGVVLIFSGLGALQPTSEPVEVIVPEMPQPVVGPPAQGDN